MAMDDDGWRWWMREYLSSKKRKDTIRLLYREESLLYLSSSSIITHHHHLYTPYTRCTLRILTHSISSMYSTDDGDGWRWAMMMEEGVSLSCISRGETLLLLYRGESLPHPTSSNILIDHHHLNTPYALCTLCTLCIRYVLDILYVLYRWWWRIMTDGDDGRGSLSLLDMEKRDTPSLVSRREAPWSTITIHHHPSPSTIYPIYSV